MYCQIEVLKFPKRPKTLFSTRPECTRNTAFRRSTANLANLIVSSFIDATQFIQIETLNSPKRPTAFISTSPESTRYTAFRRTTDNLGNLIVSSFIDATQFILKLKLYSRKISKAITPFVQSSLNLRTKGFREK